MTIKIDDKIFQEKDIDPKPKPFYHKPKPVLIDDIYKLDWEEDAELKIMYEQKQAVETIKAELTAIYEAQDEYLKAQFEPARNAFIKHFDAGDMEKALAILASPYIPAEVKPIAKNFYDKYIELKGE